MSNVNDAKYYNGELFVTGCVYGSDFPFKLGFQTISGGWQDGFISKINTSNYELEFSTYIGGNKEDECYSIDVNDQYILATGLCQGTTFPVFPLTNPNDGTYWQNNPNDDIMGIIVKLYPNGLRARVTCFGGEGSTTKIYAGKLDANSNIYITGCTYSINVAACIDGNPPANAFPLQAYGTAYYQDTHQYLSYNDLSDAFIAKFNNNNVILWSTIFGGNRNDWASDICIDGNSVYIVGTTLSYPDADDCIAADNGFPLCSSGSGYFQGTLAGGKDGFIGNFGLNGTLLHSTYFGGLNDDCLNNITTNSTGDIYILGFTQSESDPNYSLNTPSLIHKLKIYDPNNTAKREINNGTSTGATDMILCRFNQNNELQWSTYIGGQNYELSYIVEDYPILYPCDLYTDSYRNIFVIGATNSSDCGTLSSSGSINNTFNAMFDAYLVGFNNNNEEKYATYIGGSDDDYPTCITGANNKLYFGGGTNSTDYPIQQYTSDILSFYQENQTTYSDGFITSCGYSIPLDIKEDYSYKMINVYPIPCTSILQVDLTQNMSGKYDVKIFDVYGKICLIHQYTQNKISINIENLSSGIYIIECEQNNNVFRSKFIKE